MKSRADYIKQEVREIEDEMYRLQETLRWLQSRRSKLLAELEGIEEEK